MFNKIRMKLTSLKITIKYHKRHTIKILILIKILKYVIQVV
jgi:hypothetical protein